jgi:hypothetical protein
MYWGMAMKSSIWSPMLLLVAGTVVVQCQVSNINLSNFGFAFGLASSEASSYQSISFNLGINNRLQLKDSLWPSQWNVRTKLQFVHQSVETMSTSQGIRPVENELYTELVVTRHFGWRVDPFVMANVITPIAQATNPQTGNVTAAWLDPGKFAFTLGGTVQRFDSLSTYAVRIGGSLNQTVSDRVNALTDDFATVEIEKRRTTFSADLDIDLQMRIDSISTVVFKSITKYNLTQVGSINTFADAELRLKFYSIFGCIFSTKLVYNDVVSKRVQLNLGLQVAILLDS